MLSNKLLWPLSLVLYDHEACPGFTPASASGCTSSLHQSNLHIREKELHCRSRGEECATQY